MPVVSIHLAITSDIWMYTNALDRTKYHASKTKGIVFVPILAVKFQGCLCKAALLLDRISNIQLNSRSQGPANEGPKPPGKAQHLYR